MAAPEYETLDQIIKRRIAGIYTLREALEHMLDRGYVTAHALREILSLEVQHGNE